MNASETGLLVSGVEFSASLGSPNLRKYLLLLLKLEKIIYL